MKRMTAAVCGTGMMVFLGCAPAPVVQRAPELKPCYLNDTAREMSTAALLLAMEEKKWAVESASLQEGQVRAKACRVERGGDHCILADASVSETGTVNVYPTPGQQLGPGDTRMLNFWMRHLEQAYNKYRCYAPDYLRQEMKKRVWSLPQKVSQTTVGLPES